MTLFRGGGGNAILWTKRFYGHLGVSDEGREEGAITIANGRGINSKRLRPVLPFLGF